VTSQKIRKSSRTKNVGLMGHTLPAVSEACSLARPLSAGARARCTCSGAFRAIFSCVSVFFSRCTIFFCLVDFVLLSSCSARQRARLPATAFCFSRTARSERLLWCVSRCSPYVLLFFSRVNIFFCCLCFSFPVPPLCSPRLANTRSPVFCASLCARTAHSL